MSPHRLLLLVAGALLAVVTAENLGTPRNAGPDEPAHIARGAGLVRGQVFGETYGDWLVDNPPLDAGGADIANANPDSDAVQVYDVPRWVVKPSATPTPTATGRCRRRRRIRSGATSSPAWARW